MGACQCRCARASQPLTWGTLLLLLQYPYFVSLRSFDGTKLTRDPDKSPVDIEPTHVCGGMMLATSEWGLHAPTRVDVVALPCAHKHA